MGEVEMRRITENKRLRLENWDKRPEREVPFFFFYHVFSLYSIFHPVPCVPPTYGEQD